MFSLGTYNISIEKDAQMCNKDGEQSDLPRPRWYDDKSETPFIKYDSKKSQLKICVPTCTNIHESYNKLEEIMNVVLCELYNINVMLWPFYTPCKSNEDKMTSILCIKFSLNGDLIKQINNSNKKMFESISDAYVTILSNIEKRAQLLYNIVGRISASATETGIKVYIYNEDYRDKCGIKESYLGFLIAFIFSCALNYDDKKIAQDRVIEYFEVINEADRVFILDLKKCIDEVLEDINSHSTWMEASENIKKEENFIANMIDIACKYSTEGYNCRYKLKEYPDLVAEAVALIKDAILTGVNYNVINPGKNMAEFTNVDGRREIVVEGNKTNRDSYIFPFITDDKFYAKRVLKENKLNTPEGFLISKDMSEVAINSIIEHFINKPVVIKPRNTNYGIGITVYPEGTSKEYIEKAVKYAFEFDNNAILEEYALGMEYRFLIINGKCLSVAYRRSASVIGDGEHSISELIQMKNKEPWHALTGTPVKMDEPVTEFLRLQNLTTDSIPEKDKRIILRKNSNCSTGGESVVITEEMPKRFKDAAECVARAFNAKICGVDIIINDLKGDEYKIIEVNDMPGYSINEWPYEGKGERIGIEVLKLLNLI